MDFDSLFTAPLCGFADVHDYYARASSAPLLSRITVPTLILAAASDPIVPITTFETARLSPTTHLHIAPCGGHLGFISARGSDPDLRWLDWRLADWITSQNGRCKVE
jgi:predicted alpha/beta-fold hydrolase